MTLNNGILGKPLKRAEIANCIGSTATKIKELNRTTNSTIIKSFYKPFSTSIKIGDAKDGDFTISQRRVYNWGWGNLDAGGTKIMDTLRAKWNGETWSHNIPTGGINTSPYRVLDWAGYNHNSDIPFKVVLRSTAIAEGSGINFSIANLDELNNIDQWGWMGNTTKAKIGFGVYIGSSAPSLNGFDICLLAGYNAGLTFEDLLGNEKISIPAAYMKRVGATNGTYHIIPFLLADTTGITRNAIDDSNNGVAITDQMGYKTMIFMQDKLEVTVSPTVAPINKIALELYDKSVTINDYTFSCTVTSLQIKVSNSNSTARTVTVSAKPTSGYIVGNPTGAFRIVSATIPANSYITVQLVSGSISWTMVNLAALVDVTVVDQDTSSITERITIYSDKD